MADTYNKRKWKYYNHQLYIQDIFNFVTFGKHIEIEI